MMSIQQYLDKIKNAVYGREVRGAIHDAIKQTYDDASEGGDANMEVKMARGTFPNLNARLVNQDHKIDTNKTQLIQVENGFYREVNRIDSELIKKANNSDMQNGLYSKRDKSTPISLNDVDSAFASAIQGGTPVEVLSIPRDNSVTPKKTTFLVPSTNLFNPNNVLVGYALQMSNGTTYENSEYDVTDYIEVEPNTEYSVKGFQRVAYYNQNKEFTRNVDMTEDGIFNGQAATSSSTSRYMRAHYKRGQVKNLQINKGNTLLPYEDHRATLIDSKFDGESLLEKSVDLSKLDFIEKTSNLFNPYRSLKGYAIRINTGELYEFVGYSVTELIEVKPSTKYALKGFQRVVYYDENDVEISTEEITDYYEATITTPSNAKHMRLHYVSDTSHNGYIKNHQINEGDTLLPYEKYSYKFKDEVNFKIGDISSGGNNDSNLKFIIDTSLEGVFDDIEDYPDYQNTWEMTRVDDVYAMFDNLQSQYPDYISKQPLTPDLTGKQINAYHLNPKRSERATNDRLPKFFITTGTHGYERAAPLNMYLMIKHMCEKWHEYPLLEALRFNVDIIYIPIVNPFGWEEYIDRQANVDPRFNSNKIDINRQFPVGWVKRNVGDTTYGGEAPLTEIEALNIKQIFDENPDIDIYYDYHNFAGNPDNMFIWLATSSGFAQKMNDALVRKMSRKWERDFNFIPNGELVGWSSTMYEGTMHNYANSLGIKYTGTFETCDSWLWDEGVKFDQNAVKAGVEAIANWLIINLRELTK